MKKLLPLSLAAALTLSAGSLEQSFDLGFTNTTGNSKTTNLNAKYGLGYKTTGLYNNELTVKFALAAYYAENDDVKSNEEYTAALDMEQMITDGWLGYFSFDWLRNPDFKNYDGKYSFEVGAGKEIYKTSTQSLKLKLGVAYNIFDYANDQDTDTFASLVQRVDYTNKLNELSLLYVNFKAWESFEDFSKDYELGLVAGLKFNISKSVHVLVEEQINYDNLPPIGFKKTDTKTIVGLGVTF